MWNGSYLGKYNIKIVEHKWKTEGIKYFRLNIPNIGVIYCNANKTNNLLPCIIEDIKSLFGIYRRGINSITIGNDLYLIFYVSITQNNEVVYETPLNKLDNNHYLRSDPKFKYNVQKLIAFNDITGLSGGIENNIRIRPNNGELIPIGINESILQIDRKNIYDYTYIPAVIIKKWFDGKNISTQLISEMVGFNNKSLQELLFSLRNNIDNIIRNYDKEYIWYTNFIVDRISRYLLLI